MNRRSFLRLSGLTAVGAILTACGGTASVASTSSSPAASAGASAGSSVAGGLQLPTYVPLKNTPPADLPGDDKIDAGYFEFPKNLVKTVTDTPIKSGQDVNIMTWNVTGPIAPLDQNVAWQQINKEIGAKISLINNVSNADYPTKLSTVVAGGDLPDTIYVQASTAIQNFPQFLQATCQDLTPYLAGDAVKDYPNLANIPTNAWRGTRFGNSIYGVPVTFPIIPGSALYVHKDMLDAAGAPYPKDTDQFKALLQQLAKKNGTWGIGASVQGAQGTGGAYDLSWHSMNFGAPNNWLLDPSGKLVKNFETDQFKAAVSYVHDLVAAGLYYPDSASFNVVSVRTNFVAKKYAMNVSGWIAGSTQYWNGAHTGGTTSTLDIIHPFGQPGKKGSFFTGQQLFGFSVLKKAPDARIKELLHMMNYFAALFGSTEYTLLNYGIEGTDYNLDPQGNPVLTTKGKTDANSLWGYIAAPPQVYYNAIDPKGYATMMQSAEKDMVAVGVADPTATVYSPLNGNKGAVIQGDFLLHVGEIIAGQRPMSDYDSLLKAWQTAGGEQIRSEFQSALQQSK